MRILLRFQNTLVTLTLGAVLLASHSLTVAQNTNPVLNPDPRVQAYLREHADEISHLQLVIEDEGVEIGQRKKALEQLALISEDVVLPIAAKLVRDPSTEIAREAVDIVSNSAVMGGHASESSMHSAGHGLFVWSDYVKSQHELVRGALMSASKDPRPEVRLVSLKSLVRLSDETAINAVREAAKNGELTQTQAVQICSQATSNLGRACVLDFLNEGSLEGKSAAIEVLGAIPSNRPLVRNKIFLNSNADPKLRAAAADVLGRYDPAFTTYALTVIADPKIPTEVYASTLRGYAVSAQVSGKLDSAQWSAIQQALENKLQAVESDPLHNDDASSKPLRDLRESFKAGRPPF